ncbi:MAG: succinylglutamate-semialdehyde dehydrogenase [Pseudomonadota bacterium]
MTSLTGEHFIDGAWRCEGARSFASASPVTDDVVWSGYEATDEEVDAAVAAARKAFETWSRLSFDERLSFINAYSEIALAKKEDLAAIISKESGKALWDARTEAGAVAGKAGLSVKAYHERTPTKEAPSGAATLRISHHPHGVMAVLGPFNFPAHLPNGHIVPALIAGNTVVFKPSEQTPATAEFMVRMWEEAGLPAGVVNLVQGARTPAEQLVSHDDVDGVLFTGGVNAGRAIHKAMAGKPEKIVALELGGNNPLVAWDVEDVASAARIIVKSAFISAGQRCTCARRLIVPDGAEGDRIVAAVVEMSKRLSVGAPDADPQPFIGSLVSATAAQSVLTAQEGLIRDGGEALKPVEALDVGPAFLTPGLIDVTPIVDRKDEEIFGPLLQVIRVPNFEAAISEANDTRFGLAAGLISDDAALFEQFSSQVRAGVLNWNRQTTGASGAAPFGGPGLSGNHRPAGYYAADYAAWPMASLIAPGPAKDEDPIPGLLDG